LGPLHHVPSGCCRRDSVIDRGTEFGISGCTPPQPLTSSQPVRCASGMSHCPGRQGSERSRTSSQFRCTRHANEVNRLRYVQTSLSNRCPIYDDGQRWVSEDRTARSVTAPGGSFSKRDRWRGYLNEAQRRKVAPSLADLPLRRPAVKRSRDWRTFRLSLVPISRTKVADRFVISRSAVQSRASAPVPTSGGPPGVHRGPSGRAA
jgi:hypothetical protein